MKKVSNERNEQKKPTSCQEELEIQSSKDTTSVPPSTKDYQTTVSEKDVHSGHSTKHSAVMNITRYGITFSSTVSLSYGTTSSEVVSLIFSHW